MRIPTRHARLAQGALPVTPTRPIRSQAAPRGRRRRGPGPGRRRGRGRRTDHRDHRDEGERVEAVQGQVPRRGGRRPRLGDELPSEQVMESLFDALLQRQRDAVQAQDDDRVILEIQNSENSENPIWFSMRKANQFNGKVVLDKLSRVLNSNQSFLLGGLLKISYIHVPVAKQGAAARTESPTSQSTQWLERKISSKSIYSPSNTGDSMCLTRSVAVAMASGSVSRYAFCRIKKTNSTIQRMEAENCVNWPKIDPNLPVFG